MRARKLLMAAGAAALIVGSSMAWHVSVRAKIRGSTMPC
jgi:hypothetical protein